VQLDVLPISDIGAVAGEVAGDLANDSQLIGGQRPTVDSDPQHEVLVPDLVQRQSGGPPAVYTLLALGIQAPPAESTLQVLRRDRVETSLAYTCSMRARTLSASSSSLNLSLAFSGLRSPRAH